MMKLPDNSIEAKTAIKYPREAQMADRFLDYIEAKDYCNAIDIFMLMSDDSEDTEHEGVTHCTPRADIDLDDIQMLIVGAMIKRQSGV